MNLLCCFGPSPAGSCCDLGRVAFLDQLERQRPGRLSKLFRIAFGQRNGEVRRRKRTSGGFSSHESSCRTQLRSLESPPDVHSYHTVLRFLDDCDEAAALLMLPRWPGPSQEGRTCLEAAGGLATALYSDGLDLGLRPCAHLTGTFSVSGAQGGPCGVGSPIGLRGRQGEAMLSNGQQQQQQQQQQLKPHSLSAYSGCESLRLLVHYINRGARDLFDCTTPADYQVLLAEAVASEPHLLAALRDSCVSAIESRPSAHPPAAPSSAGAGAGSSISSGLGGGGGVSGSEARTVLVLNHPSYRAPAGNSGAAVPATAQDLMLQVTLQPLWIGSVPVLRPAAATVAAALGPGVIRRMVAAPAEGGREGAGPVLGLLLRFSAPGAAPPKDLFLGHLLRGYAVLAALPGIVTLMSYDGREVLFQNAASVEFMGLRYPVDGKAAAAAVPAMTAPAARLRSSDLDCASTSSLTGPGLLAVEVAATAAAAAAPATSCNAAQPTPTSTSAVDLYGSGAPGLAGLSATCLINAGLKQGPVHQRRDVNIYGSGGRRHRRHREEVTNGDGSGAGSGMGGGASTGNISDSGRGGGVLEDLFAMAPESQFQGLLCQVATGQPWRGIIPVQHQLIAGAKLRPDQGVASRRELGPTTADAAAAVTSGGGGGGGGGCDSIQTACGLVASGQGTCFQSDQTGLMGSGRARCGGGSMVRLSEETAHDNYTDKPGTRTDVLEVLTSSVRASPGGGCRHHISPTGSRLLPPQPSTQLRPRRRNRSHDAQRNIGPPRHDGGGAASAAAAADMTAARGPAQRAESRSGIRWPLLSLNRAGNGKNHAGSGAGGDGGGVTAAGATHGSREVSGSSVMSWGSPGALRGSRGTSLTLSIDQCNSSTRAAAPATAAAGASVAPHTATTMMAALHAGGSNSHSEVYSDASAIFLSTGEISGFVSGAVPENLEPPSASCINTSVTGPATAANRPVTQTAAFPRPQIEPHLQSSLQPSPTPATATSSTSVPHSISPAVPAAAHSSIPEPWRSQSLSAQHATAAAAAPTIPRRMAFGAVGRDGRSDSPDTTSDSLRTSTWGLLDTMRWMERRPSTWQGGTTAMQQHSPIAGGGGAPATVAPAIGPLRQQTSPLSAVPRVECSFSSSFAVSLGQASLAADPAASSRTIGGLPADPEPPATASASFGREDAIGGGGDGGDGGCFAASLRTGADGFDRRPPFSGLLALSPSPMQQQQPQPQQRPRRPQSSSSIARPQRYTHRPPVARFLALVAAAAASTSSSDPAALQLADRTRTCTDLRRALEGRPTASRAAPRLVAATSGQLLVACHDMGDVPLPGVLLGRMLEDNWQGLQPGAAAAHTSTDAVYGGAQQGGTWLAPLLTVPSLAAAPAALPAPSAAPQPDKPGSEPEGPLPPPQRPPLLRPLLKPAHTSPADRAASTPVSSSSDGGGGPLYAADGMLQYLVTNMTSGRMSQGPPSSRFTSSEATNAPFPALSPRSEAMSTPFLEPTLGTVAPLASGLNAELPRSLSPPRCLRPLPPPLPSAFATAPPPLPSAFATAPPPLPSAFATAPPPLPPPVQMSPTAMPCTDVPLDATTADTDGHKDAAGAGATVTVAAAVVATIPAASTAAATAATSTIAATETVAVDNCGGCGCDSCGGGDLLGCCDWHEVTVTEMQDPVTGRPALLVLQLNITARVRTERLIAELQETEHRLLESIFPRHVLEVAMLSRRGGGGDGSGSPAELQLQGDGGAPSDGTQAGSSKNSQRRAAAAAARRSRFAGAAGGRHVVHPNTYDSPTHLPLATDCTSLATYHPLVTVLFADIVGFTEMCHSVQPAIVMDFLNQLYSRLDSLLDVYGTYKVETIGDCYMVAGGLMTRDEEGFTVVRGPTSVDELHATKVLAFAKAILREASKVSLPTTGKAVLMRVGLHSGPVMSGIVGARMPRFCLFGDTVNTASRMESTCKPGYIHVSATTRGYLTRESDEDAEGCWRPTGGVQVKGKGQMNTFLWRPRPRPAVARLASGGKDWNELLSGAAAAAERGPAAAAGLQSDTEGGGGGSEGAPSGDGVSTQPLPYCGSVPSWPHHHHYRNLQCKRWGGNANSAAAAASAAGIRSGGGSGPGGQLGTGVIVR